MWESKLAVWRKEEYGGEKGVQYMERATTNHYNPAMTLTGGGIPKDKLNVPMSHMLGYFQKK